MFNEVIKQAVAGDTIILKNGIWKDVTLAISCNGNAKQPIVIEAETIGSVTIEGKSSLRIGGNYIVVSGLTFNNGYADKGNVWEFRLNNQIANNSRITNCSILEFSNKNRLIDNYWVALFGKNNRIDHCIFGDKKNLGVLMAVVLDDERSRNNNHSIDNNHFTKRIPLASNSGEIIRIGVSQHCTFYSNTIIKDNLFTNCDGETEIVSIKSCGNIVRNNIFKECQGTVVLRHGNNNTIEGNIFLGNGKEGTGGTRIINEGNWVINNIFFECRGANFRSPLAVMNGVFNSPPHRYLPVKDAVIAYNTYINCTSFGLGEGSDAERSVPPKNIYFFNNLFINNKDSLFYNIYDKIDSVYFKNNVVSNTIKQHLLGGFKKEKINHIPPSQVSIQAINPKRILPDSIYQQLSNRLAYALPETIGFNRWTAFNEAKKAKIVHQQSSNTNSNAITIKCKNADEVYAAFNTQQNQVNIQLTGTDYVFSKPIIVYKNITISLSKKGNPINWVTNTFIPTLIQIQAGSSFTLDNINIDVKGVNSSYFITSDTSENPNHYAFSCLNSIIDNYGSINSAIALFKASKSSVADSIIIQNTSFQNINSNLFILNDEQDNKGYYNVEKIKLQNNRFSNIKGAILDLYRGGNDESTMGPMLQFNQNVINNCNHSQPLIMLHGVQQSNLYNNQFIHANNSSTCIKYVDIVRALHVQKDNQFVNSGSVIENKYVVNQQ